MVNLNPRQIGDKHVKDVALEIREYLSTGTFSNCSSIAAATAQFIMDRQNGIADVRGKFETDNTNTHPDLLLTTEDGKKIAVNLYKIKNSQKIQPKNLGAKSFIEKYFQSPELQGEFNAYFSAAYKDCLKDMVGAIKEVADKKETAREYKRQLKSYTFQSNEELNEIRSRFLYELREKCFLLFLQQYNERCEGMQNAFNELFMTDSFNVISRHKGNELIKVEEFKVVVPEVEKVSLSKIGANTLGLSIENITLTLRFKFESGPTSSIKLATSFTEKKTSTKVADENRKSLLSFESAVSKRLTKSAIGADQNAIGKCSESVFYSQLLKEIGGVKQLDKQSFIRMFTEYSNKVRNKDIADIIKTTAGAVNGLIQFLDKRYGDYVVESIELVPDNYLKNRLDTADIELVIKSSGKYTTEPVSLKATQKNSGSITCKNPGVGQIMGPTYFDLNQTILTALVARLKNDFTNSDDDRRETMREVSGNIGQQLINAPERNLIKGIQALLGRAVVVIVFYRQNQHLLLEHDEEGIKDILVHTNTPTYIQNTLQWLGGTEKISLRVKFSGGKHRGWSSLKLACSHNYLLAQQTAKVT